MIPAAPAGASVWRRPRSPCGTIVGHGGGPPGYRTISFHTLDGSRQVTLDWTDWGTDADADPVAFALMIAALCPS